MSEDRIQSSLKQQYPSCNSPTMPPTCTSKCPVKIFLFVCLAWLEMASAYLGLNLYKFHQSPAETFHRTKDDPSNTLSATLQFKTIPEIISNRFSSSATLEPAQKALPWDASLQADRTLSYMPMFTHQLQKIHRRKMKVTSIDERLAYRYSHIKPARIGNMCFECDRFRKVRMTYFDGGDAIQVQSPLTNLCYIIFKASFVCE
jgi:hypothetical protein